MRVVASRRGFSLVELLTVIAIIAILASIIFPVMAMVSNKARMNKCLTQLHQIGLGVQMFKQDNRRYPDILACTVQRDPSGNVIPLSQVTKTTGPLGLFPEYVKGGARMFHCPNSKYLDDTVAMTDGASGIEFYAYDSYDFMIMPGGSIRQHYTRGWAVMAPGGNPAEAVQAVIPDDTASPRITGDAAADYERQLKFRTPPDSTVITWCSNHASISGGTFSGRAPMLYLDGHVDQQQAQQAEDYRYRLLPRKE